MSAVSLKARTSFYGLIGYVDFTLSIQRHWGNDRKTGRWPPTWRHITLGLRSPAVIQPGHLYKDGKRHVTWHRLRFGWGGGNVYLGIVYIVTTFGRSTPPLQYAKWGPFEWAWQPTLADYLRQQRDRRRP